MFALVLLYLSTRDRTLMWNLAIDTEGTIRTALQFKFEKTLDSEDAIGTSVKIDTFCLP